MQVTLDTPTVAVLPLLTKEYMDILMEKIPPRAMQKPIWDMTCGEFIECLDEDYTKCFFEEETIGAAIGHLKTFQTDMENLNKYLKLNEQKETSEEIAAKRNVVFPTFAESILITVAEFFHLKSFEEAENVPFSNYLLIFKNNSAKAKYEAQLNQIYMNKNKTKKK